MQGTILSSISFFLSIFLFMQQFHCIPFVCPFETISKSLIRLLTIFKAYTTKGDSVDYVIVFVFYLNFTHFIWVFVSFTYRGIVHQHYDFLDFLSKYKFVPKTHHQNTEENLMICYELVQTLSQKNTELVSSNELLCLRCFEMEEDTRKMVKQFQTVKKNYEDFILNEKVFDWAKIMNVEKISRLHH